jgi:hypothetical protein
LNEQENNEWQTSAIALTFINETRRIEFLLELYDKYPSGMFGEGKKKSKKTRLSATSDKSYVKRQLVIIFPP